MITSRHDAPQKLYAVPNRGISRIRASLETLEYMLDRAEDILLRLSQYHTDFKWNYNVWVSDFHHETTSNKSFSLVVVLFDVAIEQNKFLFITQQSGSQSFKLIWSDSHDKSGKHAVRHKRLECTEIDEILTIFSKIMESHV